MVPQATDFYFVGLHKNTAMIQRIQSLFLLVNIFLLLLLFKLTLFQGKTPGMQVSYTVINTVTTNSQNSSIAETNFVHIFLNAFLVLLTVVGIFLFKNRKVQMKMCLLSILILAFSFLILFLKKVSYSFTESSFLMGTYLLIIIVILYLSSYFFIKKDEELVKSADRLR